MANFAKLEVTQKTDDAIKRSVVFRARRYLPKHKRWSVQLNTGWPMDDIRNPNSQRALSKQDAKAIATTWLNPR